MGSTGFLTTWQDWAGNACYLILAFSYLVTNLYWLRALAVAALGLEGVYFYFASSPPLWVGIAWAAVFVAINLVQLLRMARERIAIRLTADDRRLHGASFAEMTPVQFHRLLRIGAWRELPAGAVLTRQDEPVPELILIAGGKAAVLLDEDPVATVGAGSFVGEMSFLNGGGATATVVALSALRLFVVAKPALCRLLKADPAAEAALLKAIGRDLTWKLSASRRGAPDTDASGAKGSPAPAKALARTPANAYAPALERLSPRAASRWRKKAAASMPRPVARSMISSAESALPI
jgi:CRP-like cAMP-binding protein